MSIKIIGTKGEVSLEFGRELTIRKKNISSIDYKFKNNLPLHSFEGFKTEIKEFVNSLKNNVPPSVDFLDGINAVRIILALYQSFKLKRSIKIN